MDRRRLSVVEAAQALNVIPQRIRQLIASGALPASKVGARWILEADDVERFSRLPRPRGRPFSPRMAWGLLAVAGGRSAPWLAPAQEQAVRNRLAHEGIAALAPRLRARSDVHRWYVHPSALPRLSEDPVVVKTGVSASGFVGNDLVAVGELELYLSQSAWERFEDEFLPDLESANPNTVLRLVRGPWPFAPGESQAWPALVAVDLLESADERTRETGARIVRALRSHA